MKLGLLVGSLCAINSLMYAELLVVKRVGKEFKPLVDPSDEANKTAIANIMLNYEWPMVIANTALTKEEQNELLTSGKSNVEEEFIRAKVKEIDPSYDVVFIPTSLYELFVISFYRKNPQDPLNVANFDLLHLKKVTNSYGQIMLSSILNITHETSQVIESKIFDIYKENNNIFYPDAFFYINNALLARIFSYYPMFADSSDINALTDELKNRSTNFAARLILAIDSSSLKRMKREIDPKDASAAIKSDGVLAKVITLEYEARAANKALLFRGTSRMQTEKSDTSKDKLVLMGNVLRTGSTVLESYEARNLPYSISFGNSLFAGWFMDSGEYGACAYQYLISQGGYALFVDKKYYIKNKLMGPSTLDLFFIAPLAPLAALFTSGEYFHSRSKAVLPLKEMGKGNDVKGLADQFIDPHGVLTVIRDPFVHAQLFSKYLAQNMRIISRGDESNLTEQEKKVYEEKKQQEEQHIKSSQKELAQYYAGMRFATTAAQKIKQKILEKREQEKKEAVAAPVQAQESQEVK